MKDRLDNDAMAKRFGRPAGGWRQRWYTVIFEADTPGGKLFDLLLIGAILVSVMVVILHTLPNLAPWQDTLFRRLEWVFTLIFTAEYIARLSCVDRPLRYARSFFGVIDLLSVLPTYIAVFVPEAAVFVDVRVLRVLRVFRVLKLTQYMAESSALAAALYASRRKILVFLSFVLMVVLIAATLMFVIEGPENGYTSIPLAMYWAITTMTTVGFGDITPKTDIGRFLTSLMMLLGWGVLAVPTGIVTAEMTARRNAQGREPEPACPACGATPLPQQSRYCWQCGAAVKGGDPAA
jgi:voltage-gated potassium channel